MNTTSRMNMTPRGMAPVKLRSDGEVSPSGRVATAARRTGHRHTTVRRYTGTPNPVRHLDNVTAYATRLRHWINRFHGVATRYLDNYLAWHRTLDPEVDTTWAMALAGSVSCLPPGPAPP